MIHSITLSLCSKRNWLLKDALRCCVLMSHTLSTICQIYFFLPWNCCCNCLLLCGKIVLCVIHRHWHLAFLFDTHSQLVFFRSLCGYSFLIFMSGFFVLKNVNYWLVYFMAQFYFYWEIRWFPIVFLQSRENNVFLSIWHIKISNYLTLQYTFWM